MAKRDREGAREKRAEGLSVNSKTNTEHEKTTKKMVNAYIIIRSVCT